ncbi:MAG: LacI family DNA-binding transcriptional regulator [Bacteroidota bacterium]
MKKRVRIKDIADKAEVSTGTVDRVLHNRGNVASEVKKRVLEVIDELGYERNIIASTLAYNKTVRVASILPIPENDLYWLQTNQGIQKAIKAVKHFGLLVEEHFFDFEIPGSFVEVAQKALNTQPDGILFPPMFAEEAQWLIDNCTDQQIPYVIINTNLNGAKPLSYIGQDSYQSGVLGARLLNFGLAKGSQVCILNLDFSTKAAQHLIDKERGFRDYFNELGPQHIQIIRKDFDKFNHPGRLRSFLESVLEENPSLRGLFVTNSRAYKVVNSIEDIIIDKDIKIVGFDLISPNLAYLQENKISFLINQNPADQGFRGIHSLFRHLVRKEAVEKEQYLPLDIIVKENAAYHVKRITDSKVVL